MYSAQLMQKTHGKKKEDENRICLSGSVFKKEKINNFCITFQSMWRDVIELRLKPKEKQNPG